MAALHPCPLQEYERRGASQVQESEAVSAWLVGGEREGVEARLREQVGLITGVA